MIRDLDIIKILTKKEQYDKFLPFINQDGVCRETKLLIQDFGAYYEKFPHEVVDFDQFITFFHHLRHPDYNKDEKDLYDKLFIRLQEPLSETAELLMERYKAQSLGQEISEAIKTNPSVDVYTDIIDKQILKENKTLSKLEFVDMNLDHALVATDPLGGYKWRLNALNTTLGTLTPWTFGVVAARPNAGKSSFLVSEMSYICQQLRGDETILWLNNENKGDRIVPRLYSAMFNMRRDDIILRKNEVSTRFKDLGGERIKILDIQNQSYKYVTKVVKLIKPRIVIIDMLDNLKGFNYNNGNETVDAKFGYLYQWALELSCLYNCTVIGTSQMSALTNQDGTERLERYPSMSRLVGSKTLKQGGASWILMIGQDGREGYLDARYLSAPKSKFGDGQFKADVRIDSERALFLSHDSPFRYYRDELDELTEQAQEWGMYG